MFAEKFHKAWIVQKQQLVCYGYYHDYKGYRFYNKDTNRIPYTDFNEIIAVIEYDNNLKAMLYPDLMFLETAIKNIVCNMSVVGLKDEESRDSQMVRHFYNRGEDVPVWIHLSGKKFFER